jgi:hypothetical protein
MSFVLRTFLGFKDRYAPAVKYDHNSAWEKFLGSAGAAKSAPVAAAVASVETEVPAKAVESDMSFFSKLKSEIVSMWKKAPAAEVALASGVNFIVPFVEELDTLATPELAPIVNPILDKVKTGLSALSVTIKGVGSTVNVSTIASSITANLSGLEAAVQIKDPATATKINSIATLIAGEISAIVAALPA